MMTPSEITLHLVRRDGAPYQLYAVTPTDPRSIARGVFIDLLHAHTPHALTLRQPWAIRGAVVTRHSERTRAKVSVNDHHVATYMDDNSCDIATTDVEDAESLAYLWLLRQVKPTLDDMCFCVLLRAAFDDADHLEQAVLAWCDGEFAPIIRANGLPTGPLTARRLVATAHAIELPVHYPHIPSSTEAVLTACAAVIPPRWVMADDLRILGRPDLAELVMAAGAS